MIRHAGGPIILVASISGTTIGRGSSYITGHNRPDDGGYAVNRNQGLPDHAARGVIDETVGGLMRQTNSGQRRPQQPEPPNDPAHPAIPL